MVPWGTITNFHGLIVGKIDRESVGYVSGYVMLTVVRYLCE